MDLEEPLFPGYVFTHISLNDRAHVYNVPGVLKILSFNGLPAVIDEEEIRSVKVCVAQGKNIERHVGVVAGTRIRIVSGPFEGVEGVVLRGSNQRRVIVSIAMIQQSISMEVDFSILQVVEQGV